MTRGSHELLRTVIAPHIALRPVADDIRSALPSGTSSPQYDGRARLYDRLVGSTIYNRLAWGLSPTSYTHFAREAAASGTGLLLDAGCGTLVSTAAVHATSGRPTILLDLSSDMLAAARDRLMVIGGSVADHLALLQADLHDLPLRSEAFETILCPGILPLIDDVAGLARSLARVAAPGARLYFSSLVAEQWLGTYYLAVLRRAGEVARPRTAAELLAALDLPGCGPCSD